MVPRNAPGVCCPPPREPTILCAVLAKLLLGDQKKSLFLEF